MRTFSFVLILFFICPIFLVSAQEVVPNAYRSTNLPLPRFVSLSSDKVYVRAGPGLQYPIRWEFQKEELPVEIILEYGAWRKIRDYEGAEGWIHSSLLSVKRYVLIAGAEKALMKSKPKHDGRSLAALEPRVIARLHECKLDWCKIDVSGYKGWVYKNFLWGVYDKEEFD